MEVWGLMGGYELQRMPVVDAITVIRDPEATVYCLGAIRDTLNERDA